MAPLVTVRKQKWGGRPHVVATAELLGTDEFGTWLYVPEQDTITNRAVSCVPAGEWWMAHWIFDRGGAEHKVFVDIGTPPVWTASDEVVFVDLEMDVERTAGATTLLDVDGFHDRARAVPYPAEVVSAARRTAEAVIEAVRGRVEPFDRRGPRWFLDAGGHRR